MLNCSSEENQTVQGGLRFESHGGFLTESAARGKSSESGEARAFDFGDFDGHGAPGKTVVVNFAAWVVDGASTPCVCFERRNRFRDPLDVEFADSVVATFAKRPSGALKDGSERDGDDSGSSRSRSRRRIRRFAEIPRR
jgi:hypothetical protein